MSLLSKTEATLPFAEDAVLCCVADYWSRLRAGRPMPNKAELDPLHLPPHVWPNLLLVEPVTGSGDLRYRLVGSAHVERYGYDFTGRTIAEIASGSYRTYLEEQFRHAMTQSQPVYSESLFRWDTTGYAVTRRLIMPLATDTNDSGIMAFCAQTWPTPSTAVNRITIPAMVKAGSFDKGYYQPIDLP